MSRYGVKKANPVYLFGWRVVRPSYPVSTGPAYRPLGARLTDS